MKKAAVLCFSLFIFHFSFSQNAPKAKDSLPKVSLSVSEGASLPVSTYFRPGPATGIDLNIPTALRYFSLGVKAIYMFNKFTANEQFDFLRVIIVQKQINLLAGPCFTLPINRFSITVNAMAGFCKQPEEDPQNIYSAGINLQYSLSSKWLVKLNSDFLDLISSYYNPEQYVVLTTGVGYRF